MSKKDKYTIEDLLYGVQKSIKPLMDSLENVSEIGFIDSQINLKELSKKNVDIIKAHFSDIEQEKPEDITEQKLEILKQNIIDNLSINIVKYYFNCRAFKKISELTGKSDINIIKGEDSNYFLETEEIYEPEFVEEEIGELTEEEESDLDKMLETETEEVEELPEEEKLEEELNKDMEELFKEEEEELAEMLEAEKEENQELYRKETGGNPIRNRKPTKRYLKWLEEKK